MLCRCVAGVRYTAISNVIVLWRVGTAKRPGAEPHREGKHWVQCGLLETLSTVRHVVVDGPAGAMYAAAGRQVWGWSLPDGQPLPGLPIALPQDVASIDSHGGVVSATTKARAVFVWQRGGVVLQVASGSPAAPSSAVHATRTAVSHCSRWLLCVERGMPALHACRLPNDKEWPRLAAGRRVGDQDGTAPRGATPAQAQAAAAHRMQVLSVALPGPAVALARQASCVFVRWVCVGGMAAGS